MCDWRGGVFGRCWTGAIDGNFGTAQEVLTFMLEEVCMQHA